MRRMQSWGGDQILAAVGRRQTEDRNMSAPTPRTLQVGTARRGLMGDCITDNTMRPRVGVWVLFDFAFVFVLLLFLMPLAHAQQDSYGTRSNQQFRGKSEAQHPKAGKQQVLAARGVSN
jgi:hypothetical protein